jgi:hypothetical protein
MSFKNQMDKKLIIRFKKYTAIATTSSRSRSSCLYADSLKVDWAFAFEKGC